MRDLASSAQFPRNLRLRSNKDFQRVWQRPRKFNGRYFMLIISPNHLTRPRLGLGISKKKVPTAVARNRIKRIIRESFRKQWQHFEGIDIVVTAKIGAAALESKTIREQIEELWQILTSYLAKS